MGVTQVGATLSSNQNDATYQWIDCNAFASIPGETAQSFTASENGTYAVQITVDNCVDTSDCTSIVNVGIDEVTDELSVAVFPNPSQDYVHVSSSERLVSICVYDIMGNKLIQTTDPVLCVSSLPKGIYFLQASSESNETLVSFMK